MSAQGDPRLDMLFRNLKPLILASGSARRIELLRSLGILCTVVPSGFEENDHRTDSVPERVVQDYARAKAQAVSLLHKDNFILSADTVVVVDGRILGKPSDPDDAARMLRILGGREHHVLTGVFLLHPGASTYKIQVVRTAVLMRPLSEDVIWAYVNSGEPFDKAGSYGIQGLGAFLVKSIHGSYTNVVGLPLSETVQWLLEEEVVVPCAAL